MRAEVLICDLCHQKTPRLIELDRREYCGPCLLGVVSGLVREGLVRLIPEMQQPRREATVLRVRR